VRLCRFRSMLAGTLCGSGGKVVNRKKMTATTTAAVSSNTFRINRFASTLVAVRFSEPQLRVVLSHVEERIASRGPVYLIPASDLSALAWSVRSQLNSGSFRPKCPNAAVFL
jgi:hypothetical protein